MPLIHQHRATGSNGGALLWEPDPERIEQARITGFIRRLARDDGVDVDGYDGLWRWSVSDPNAFWLAFARWYGIRWHRAPTTALSDQSMPGAKWFPDGRLNYAEHALFPPTGGAPGESAVVYEREDGARTTMTWAQLRDQVASVRSVLLERGVGVGDRVAALLPNGPEALVAMLATATLGAVWSCCSPDFGPRAVADRFAQIEPAVLLTVDGYLYGGRRFDIRESVARLRTELPTVHTTITVPYLDPDAELPDSLRWPDLTGRSGLLAFEPMPFDAPMWILYSSGTTGLPKPIVHGHGGILIEHAKQLALHLDLGPGDRFFWFSTTGWMMWNFLVSGLLVGATIVLFDGHPAHPAPDRLWQLAEATGISCFGVSAAYVQGCMRAGLRPGRDFDLSALRSIGSTGAPLPPEGFAWVYDEVKPDVQLNSMSGGTDVCTAFVGGVPTLPVRAGEIPTRALACSVDAFDPSGRPLVGKVGELVVTAPMPSMPVGFWGDDGTRLRESYFDVYPGVWRHGDWITITERGTCVVHGRSDSTLNRGGVRMGTAEFYRVVEEIPGILDSLVIDTSGSGDGARLLLFVVLAEGLRVDDVRDAVCRRIRGELSPRHVPDDVIAIAEVPRTLNGKKCEIPVKRVLAGIPLSAAVSLEALRNPDAMHVFEAFRSSSRDEGGST